MSFRKSDRERMDSLIAKIDKLTDEQSASNKASNEAYAKLSGQLMEMAVLLKEKSDAYSAIKLKYDAQSERIKVMLKGMYGSKSQKGISQKKSGKASREVDKDNFDGTPESLSQADGPSGEESPQAESALAESPAKVTKEMRMYRRGLEYRKMKAGKSIPHKSDMCKLPQGAQVIKVFFKYSYE